MITHWRITSLRADYYENNKKLGWVEIIRDAIVHDPVTGIYTRFIVRDSGYFKGYVYGKDRPLETILQEYIDGETIPRKEETYRVVEYFDELQD